LGAVAPPRQDQRLRPMCQAIQSGGGEQGIPKQLRPLRRRSVARNHNAADLVAFVNHVIEVGGRRSGEGLEPEIIQDEEVGPDIGGQAALKGIVSPSPMQVRQHLVGGDKEHVEALPTGFVRKRLGKVTFDAAMGMPSYEGCCAETRARSLASRCGSSSMT
jgi:hypothetical protein